MILLSGWTVMILTIPFKPAPMEKVLSIDPSALSRARRVEGVPLKEPKLPPTRIFPSGCSASDQTGASIPVPGLKVASSDPFSFKRAIRFWLTLLNAVKRPPTIIFPLGCKASS